MAEPRETAPGRQRRKGPRPKHVPQRTCIACREKGDKRGLIRIVRTPELDVVVDPTGKRNGRGAYLCHQSSCWNRALGGPILSKALNVDINDDARNDLEKYAATLRGDESSDRTAATSS